MLFLMASWRQMHVDGERPPARAARQDTAAGALLSRIFSKTLFGSFSRKCPQAPPKQIRSFVRLRSAPKLLQRSRPVGFSMSPGHGIKS